MASTPTQTQHDPKKPSASSDSKSKAKFAARNLRIDTHLPYKDDDPSTCTLARGSPVTAIPPLPPKSEKRKKGPSGVPMDSLLAPKSVFTPPLPFRRDEPGWRPPRFDRGSRPHCPEKLYLSDIHRWRYIDKYGRRVYATRNTALLSPQAIPADVPLIKPTARAPQAKVSEEKVPETAIPPTQVSPMKASPSMVSTEPESVLSRMPFTDPSSPISSASSDSLPEIMTRQRRKRREEMKQATHSEEDFSEEDFRQIYQANYPRLRVTETPRNQEAVFWDGDGNLTYSVYCHVKGWRLADGYNSSRGISTLLKIWGLSELDCE
ncbi:uncharacterized protein NECHADRAFT_77457 [Fusarium vanettenii 77-13-4]|uniref:Uncharacterized protein n=1 Tax=Fusarium vanettenii (strain ATCC MYA-4622 / CBS 123669 / FGSC 9596 / NRRL 45880 / 77-13-4) TaxID=660122 RepID=C7YLA1_FUSV7|nr:uncharacterized protein NECHADRAFT_77457 [Fusarium vanettenii 77-13-4]EEU46752.1 predicted protein [Fusarium vanettenii 77-13-4]